MRNKEARRRKFMRREKVKVGKKWVCSPIKPLKLLLVPYLH
jgi:hypothetical protein